MIVMLELEVMGMMVVIMVRVVLVVVGIQQW